MSIKNYTIIKHRDVPAMQAALEADPCSKHLPQQTKLTFSNYAEYRKHVNNIDLYSFLGVPAYKKIVCPICGATAGYVSYYDEEEVWTYRCFAEKESYNIIGIAKRIAGCSYSQTLEFINQVYNISLAEDTPLNRAIEYNIRVLSDASFKEIYPCMAKFLGSYYALSKDFFRCLQSLHNERLHTKDGREVIILTTQEARQMLRVGQEKARTFLRWLTLLSVIDAVHMSELDYPSRRCLERISDCGRLEYASIFRVNLLDEERLITCETKAKELLPLRLTKGNMSLKTIRAITSDSVEDYEIVSPNYSVWKRGTANFAAEEAIQIFSDLLMDSISKNGYTREKDLPVRVKLKRTSLSGEQLSVPVEWREVRSAVIEQCGCSPVLSNRDQLRLLGITEMLSGILIVPKEMVYSCEADVGAVLNDIAVQGYAMASYYLPITQNHRKQFRDMLEQCGIVAVRLNDELRLKYGITDFRPYTEIYIERNEGKA